MRFALLAAGLLCVGLALTPSCTGKKFVLDEDPVHPIDPQHQSFRARPVPRFVLPTCQQYRGTFGEPEAEIYLKPRILSPGKPTRVSVGLPDHEKRCSSDSQLTKQRFFAEWKGHRVELSCGTLPVVERPEGVLSPDTFYLGVLEVSLDDPGWTEVTFFREEVRVGVKSLLAIDDEARDSGWEPKVFCQTSCTSAVQLDNIVVYVDGTPVTEFDRIVDATRGTLVDLAAISNFEGMSSGSWPERWLPTDGIALRIALPEPGFLAGCEAVAAVADLEVPGVRLVVVPEAVWCIPAIIGACRGTYPSANCFP
jgi:hypothetical protein